jgi:hypothetical protein
LDKNFRKILDMGKRWILEGQTKIWTEK